MIKTVCFQCENPQPGDIVYLVNVEFTNTGETRLDAYAEPQRKNMSREECVEGWLGTTDNIDREAVGMYRIISVNPEGEYWLAGRKTELDKI